MPNDGGHAKASAGFLGEWVLDTGACLYAQGEPPRFERQRISAEGEDLIFEISSESAKGENHTAVFRGKPDGVPVAFDGGPLADAICLAAPSPDTVTISAFRNGALLMVAERRLSRDGSTMHLHQQVYLPDGTAPSNHGDYRRVQ